MTMKCKFIKKYRSIVSFLYIPALFCKQVFSKEVQTIAARWNIQNFSCLILVQFLAAPTTSLMPIN
jgi:hypothetical protein